MPRIRGRRSITTKPPTTSTQSSTPSQPSSSSSSTSLTLPANKKKEEEKKGKLDSKEKKRVSINIPSSIIENDHSKPIPLNTKLFCLFNNPFTGEKEYRSCIILEVESTNSTNNPYVYYIHYNNLDRRMDEWVERHRLASAEDIKLLRSQPIIYEEEKNEIKSKKRKSSDQDTSLLNSLSFITKTSLRSSPCSSPTSLTPSPNFSTPLSSAKTPFITHDISLFELTLEEQEDRIRAAQELDEDEEEHGHAMNEADMDPESLAAHHEATKVKNIGSIIINGMEMETW